MNRQLLTLFAFGAALGGCASEPQAPVKDYMAQEVQPTADIYWKSVQYISDEDGMHEIFPRTDAEWEDVRQAAVRLGEIGAELKEPRFAEGRGAAWIDFSDGLIEVAKQAEQQAADKSVDGVFEVSGTVYAVCQACHQAFPPENPPEGFENGGE